LRGPEGTATERGFETRSRSEFSLRQVQLDVIKIAINVIEMPLKDRTNLIQIHLPVKVNNSLAELGHSL
jgi:hypothetical protein